MNGHGQVVEWAPFRLRPGRVEAELLKASDELQSEFLARQSGYIRRELVKGADGGFVDIVWWTDRRAAEEAMARVAASEVCARYFSLMREEDAGAGAGVAHFLTLKAY